MTKRGRGDEYELIDFKADEGAGHNEFECWSKVILVWWEEEYNEVTNVQNVHKWLNKKPLSLMDKCNKQKNSTKNATKKQKTNKQG